jgi:hypothetical protein
MLFVRRTRFEAVDLEHSLSPGQKQVDHHYRWQRQILMMSANAKQVLTLIDLPATPP